MDRFGPQMWKDIGDGLRGEAERWWKENQDDLVELGKEEAEQMLLALQSSTLKAKEKLAIYWAKHDRDSWDAYRDGTTDQLEGIAARRARIMDALKNLGRRAAELIGAAAGAVLGL